MKDVVVSIRLVDLPGYSSQELLSHLRAEVDGLELYAPVHRPNVIQASDITDKIIAHADTLLSILSSLVSVYCALKEKGKTSSTTQIVVKVEQEGGLGQTAIDDDVKSAQELREELNELMSEFRALRASIGHPNRDTDQAEVLRHSPNWKRKN